MFGNDVARRATAAQMFHRARRQAALESLVGRLSGQSVDLLSFDEVVSKLGMRGQYPAGVQEVPLEAIIGSVGRYLDFSRSFLPRQEEDRDRWINVITAAESVADLPPVELYRINNNYFVLDGNHRISIARRQGLTHIDAHVVDVQTRAPLPEGAAPDDLIIAAEYASFLTYTGLDRYRPDLDLLVSVPGQYAHLENHIEAQRYLREVVDERDYTLEEAAVFWYDTVYLPLVRSIREHGILRYFPGRTETDFFVWLSRHRVALRNELGIEVTPDETVTHLLARVSVPEKSEQSSLPGRIQRRLRHLVVPDRVQANAPSSWAESKTIDRYSDRLFASMLLALHAEAGQPLSPAGKHVLDQALALVLQERARLHILCITSSGLAISPDEIEDRESLLPASGEQDIEFVAGRESTEALLALCKLAVVHDMVMVDRELVRLQPAYYEGGTWLDRLVIKCGRPVFISGKDEEQIPAERILLAINGSPQAREALFLATYLAETWGSTLLIQTPASRTEAAVKQADIAAYLAMHEVGFQFLEPSSQQTAADQLADIAGTTGSKMIVMSGPHELDEAQQIEELCRRSGLPLLLTT